VLTFILDVVHVGFLEILYHIPSTICEVITAYEGEHLSIMRVYEIKHICNNSRMCVIMVSRSQLGMFPESKV